MKPSFLGGFIMAFNFMNVGKRVGEIRKLRGLSQYALAERVNKSPTYISYIEGGLKSMSLDTFVAIANVLRVSADELLKDSLENTGNVSNHEFDLLLSDCSEYEKRVIIELAVAAKKILGENRHLIYRRKE